MGEIRIVGTAHVSARSVEEVRKAFEEFSPDVVAVELDPARHAVLTRREEPPDIGALLKGGHFTELLVQWLLAYLQRRIGMDTGVEPGAEMRVALDLAGSGRVPVALIDRDIRVTLARFWHALTLWEKLSMIYTLAVSLVAVEEEEIDVDALTGSDMISLALEEFRKFSPRGAQALIDERDAILASRILALSAAHERVLAVVGAGHVRGVEKFLAAPETIPPMESLTAPARTIPYGKIFGSLVLGFFILLCVALALSGVGFSVLLLAFAYWVLIHGVLAAAFALAAGGHPLSALTAFAVSWMTSLNPFLAAGWFAAPVEARVRRPGVGDFRRIMEAGTLSEMREIPLFRVILVAALTNVGSMLGTFLYFLVIFPALGIDPGVLVFTGLGNLGNLLQGLSGP